MDSFVFQVDKDIMRFEIDYGQVDVYILKKNYKGKKEFKYQSTSTPESILKHFKRYAEVICMYDYNYRSIKECVEVLNKAKEYI